MVTTTTTKSWSPMWNSLDLSCLLCAVCKSVFTDCRDISTLYYINHLDMVTTTTTKSWSPMWNSLDLSCLLCAVCKSVFTGCKDISTLYYINHLDMVTTTTTKSRSVTVYLLSYSFGFCQQGEFDRMYGSASSDIQVGSQLEKYLKMNIWSWQERVLWTFFAWSNENKSCMRVDKREFTWEFHQLSLLDQTRTRVAWELTSESLHESFINFHCLIKREQELHESWQAKSSNENDLHCRVKYRFSLGFAHRSINMIFILLFHFFSDHQMIVFTQTKFSVWADHFWRLKWRWWYLLKTQHNMKFLSEKIYCNSSPTDPNLTTM